MIFQVLNQPRFSRVNSIDHHLLSFLSFVKFDLLKINQNFSSAFNKRDQSFSILIISMTSYEISELCPTLRDSMNCSPPDSSICGIFQARIMEWVAISSCRDIFPTQASNPRFLCLLHCRLILYPLSHNIEFRKSLFPEEKIQEELKSRFEKHIVTNLPTHEQHFQLSSIASGKSIFPKKYFSKSFVNLLYDNISP